MKKIAVILAGCGRMDGSEIHESVLTLLSIQQAGAIYQCFSLDQAQVQVVNHLTNESEPTQTRNMLVESARIARGDVLAIEDLKLEDYAGLIIPGGNGIAANLFTLAKDGIDFQVNSQVANSAREFTQAGKPVGFICIAPVMIPAIYDVPIHMTIGTDESTAKIVEARGAIHHNCSVTEICTDDKHKIVSTPAYMLAQNIGECYIGINKLVQEVLRLAE